MLVAATHGRLLSHRENDRRKVGCSGDGWIGRAQLLDCLPWAEYGRVRGSGGRAYVVDSNVRSLALSLGKKRVLTARCEESLHAIQDALSKRAFAGTR